MADLDTDSRVNRASGRARRYMGQATDDPSYLPKANPNGDRSGSSKPFTAQADISAQKRALNHYDRYLQAPASKRAIFSSRYDRRNRTLKRALVCLIVLAIALALIWIFVLR